MQRLAAIFTVLVFAVLLGGLCMRDGAPTSADRPAYEPSSPPNLPPMIDPLGSRSSPGAPQGAQGGGDRRRTVRVTDDAGAPVRGAALVVRSGDAVVWANTDESGLATLEGLAPGKSRLAVLSWPRLGYEIDVEAAPQDAAPLEVALPPPPEFPARFAETPRSNFAGRLEWTASDSPAGYQVVLLPLESPAVLGTATARSADCDAEGRFLFEGLAHGRYALCVLPAWARGGSWPDLASPAARELDFRGDALGDGAGRTIALARGSIEGVIADDEGRPFHGALVIASDSLRESRVWPAATTDPEGRFRIRDVPPGTYRVVCRAGEGGSTLDSLAVAPGEAAMVALPPFSPRRKP